MEQMIQQMMLGGGSPNNNNNNNSIADHPMIRQLQSQFPDHNIRDLLQQMSSPYAQQQMERSLELQLSQLDHLPGGMNLIQNAYREQMEQASNNTNNTNSSGSSSSDSNINPMEDFFSGLGGGSGMGRSSQGHATDNNYNNNNNTMAGPMGQAMPNPWSSHQPFPRRRRLVAPTATTTTRAVTTTTTPSNANPSTQNPWNMTTTHSSTSTQHVGMAATPMDESTSRHPDDNHDDNNNNSTQVNEELLYEMGFTDRTLNRRILLEQDNNLDRTVEALLLLSRPRDS